MSNLDLDDLEAKLAANRDWPWIRPWASWKVHAPGNDDVLDRQEAIDLAVAAVNSLPALIAAARRAEALEKALDEILATVYSPDIDTYTDKSYSALHLKAIRIAQQARATLSGEGAPR